MSPVSIVLGPLHKFWPKTLAGMGFYSTCLKTRSSGNIFGAFSRQFFMQSGAPTFGTPEPGHIMGKFSVPCQAIRRAIFPSGGGVMASKKISGCTRVLMNQLIQFQASALAGVPIFLLHTAGLA
ncbi:MAG: hypothetical protein Ct9H300mP6_07290 [Gammaproteobacteria bacterium]|nr:MAG: hypothetical protein Ct9H300mP6_07290 [Gammaproteobacteria bacterium]